MAIILGNSAAPESYLGQFPGAVYFDTLGNARTPTEDGTLVSASVWVKDGAATGRGVKIGLYDADLNLLATADITDTSGAEGFKTALLDTPVAVTTAQSYRFGTISQTRNPPTIGTGGSRFWQYDDGLSYANPLPSPPAVDGSTGTPADLRIYFSTADGPSATITDLDTDNSVTAYQQANANGVSGFGGPITSGTFGGEAVTIIGGDWETNGGVVSLRVPGNLATGTFDLVLSDGTDSATLSGVTFTQTHPYEAPYGLVDSNSAWREQRLTPGTRWRVTREFQYITYDYTASQAETPPDGNDLNDHAEADPGYTGADYQDREVLYSDGTTATYRVNVTVGEGGNITTRRSLRRKLRRALRILLRREL